MSTQSPEVPGVKPESPLSARERFQQKRHKPTPPAKKTPRTASPTRTIEPGLVHERIAVGILKGTKQRASQAGIELDVGEFPEHIESVSEQEDPTRLTQLVAHAVARLGDKFSMVRKVSRHMEGTEKRAGILSDITAAAYVLYKRNPEAMESLAQKFGQEFQARRVVKASQTNGGGPAATTKERVAYAPE